MNRCSTEFVQMFWDEQGNPIGFIHENGKREIFACRRASKADLVEIFKIEQIPDRKP